MKYTSSDDSSISRKTYTVSQLTREIGEVLEARFPLLWIEGEISNFRVPSSGHYYFSLKDEISQIRAVMFKYQNKLLAFRPEDGQQVIGLGRLTVYEPRGEYQIVFETLEPKGRGALQLAFERLKKKLLEEGLFDREKKKSLPYLPRKVAVVTSPTGAAVRDFLKILRDRYPNMEVLIYPVRVQGTESAADIAEALDLINRDGKTDVIVLTRGGGSLEDLWSFNTEVVARAIHRSTIPIISAVGHEIDFTISDFVADKRAPTPSAAAEILAPRKDELEASVKTLKSMLERRVSSHLLLRSERLSGLSRGVKDPRKYLGDLSQRIDELGYFLQSHWANSLSRREIHIQALRDGLNSRALNHSIASLCERVSTKKREFLFLIMRKLERNHQALRQMEKLIEATSPKEQLKRGYSITRKMPDLLLVNSFEDVSEGEHVQVLLGKGNLVCKVEEASPDGVEQMKLNEKAQ